MLFAISTALAGNCDALTAAIPKTERTALVGLLDKLVACDKNEANKSFKAFVRAGSDVDTLVDLSLSAFEVALDLFHICEGSGVEVAEGIELAGAGQVEGGLINARILAFGGGFQREEVEAEVAEGLLVGGVLGIQRGGSDHLQLSGGEIALLNEGGAV